MSTQQNKDIVRRFHDAVTRGDLDAAEQCLSPNVRAYMPGSPEPLGKGAFKQMGSMFMTAFPDLKNILDEVICEGDIVATLGRYTGTHLGEFQGIPPTGRRVEMGWLGFDRVVDGKIVEHHWEQNSMALMQQLGVIPAQPQAQQPQPPTYGQPPHA